MVTDVNKFPKTADLRKMREEKYEAEQERQKQERAAARKLKREQKKPPVAEE